MVVWKEAGNTRNLALVSFDSNRKLRVISHTQVESSRPTKLQEASNTTLCGLFPRKYRPLSAAVSISSLSTCPEPLPNARRKLPRAYIRKEE